VLCTTSPAAGGPCEIVSSGSSPGSSEGIHHGALVGAHEGSTDPGLDPGPSKGLGLRWLQRSRQGSFLGIQGCGLDPDAEERTDLESSTGAPEGAFEGFRYGAICGAHEGSTDPDLKGSQGGAFEGFRYGDPFGVNEGSTDPDSEFSTGSPEEAFEG
jgi:hypothetical protein